MESDASASAFDVTTVSGNVSDEIKKFLGDHRNLFATFWKPGHKPLNSFAQTIQQRMRVTERSVYEKAEEPHKVEGRAVLEIEVAEGMRQ